MDTYIRALAAQEIKVKQEQNTDNLLALGVSGGNNNANVSAAQKVVESCALQQPWCALSHSSVFLPSIAAPTGSCPRGVA